MMPVPRPEPAIRLGSAPVGSGQLVRLCGRWRNARGAGGTAGGVPGGVARRGDGACALCVRGAGGGEEKAGGQGQGSGEGQGAEGMMKA